MKTTWWTLRQICRDGAGSEGSEGGAGASGAGDGSGDPGAGSKTKTFTQDEVNSLLAKEKRIHAARVAESLAKLEAIEKEGLTPEAKRALEQQIETLRNQTATTEELAKQALEKSRKEWQTTEASLREQLREANQRYEDLHVQTLFDSAMAIHGVKPGAAAVINAYLRGNLQKVPVLNELGKPTGKETYTINVTVPGSDGTTKVLQLSPEKAVAQMREQDDFAPLFAAPAKAGLGGTGGAGGKVDLKNLTQAQYMELRKTNPAALGLPTRT